MTKKLLITAIVVVLLAGCASDENNDIDFAAIAQQESKSMMDSLSNHIIGTWVCTGAITVFDTPTFDEFAQYAQHGIIDSCSVTFGKAPLDTIVFRSDNTMKLIRLSPDSTMTLYRLSQESNYSIDAIYEVSASGFSCSWDIDISYNGFPNNRDRYEHLIFERGYNTLYMSAWWPTADRYSRLQD